ncbi:MAG: hypothetical protein AMXMBFR84_26100 [Candidatus Hydrogenedentota bacterium]
MAAKLNKYTIKVTTNGSGAFVGGVGVRMNGFVHSIRYRFGDLASTTDIQSLVGAVNGQSLWAEADLAQANKMIYPRAQVHTTAGVAATLDGTRPMMDRIPLVDEDVVLTVAQGGDTKTGYVDLFVQEA